MEAHENEEDGSVMACGEEKELEREKFNLLFSFSTMTISKIEELTILHFNQGKPSKNAHIIYRLTCIIPLCQ